MTYYPLPASPSTGMDAATTAVLQTFSNQLVRAFAAIVFETYLLAIYTVLVFQAVRALIRKGLTRASLTTLIVLLTMFAMALTLIAFDITNFVHEAQYTLLYNPDLPMTKRFNIATQKVYDLLAPLDLIYAIEALLGDGIIIWRVWALWGYTERRWLVIFPLLLFLGSFIAMFLLGYCVIHLGTSIVDGSFQNPAFCKNVQTVSYILPTVTTAVATLLIGWRTWEYHKLIKPVVSSLRSGNPSRSRKVERLLMLFVESGVIYFIFFLIIVIGNIPGIENNPNISFAFFVYSYSTSVVVGMYPTIITLLTKSDNRVLDSGGSTTLTSQVNPAKPTRTRNTTERGTMSQTDDMELSTMAIRVRKDVR